MIDEKAVERIKKEISYHSMCKKCTSCGECERVLEIALKEEEERRDERGMPRPCKKCRL